MTGRAAAGRGNYRAYCITTPTMPKPTPELRTAVAEALAARRPLSASTLRTYTSLLSNLLARIEQDDPAYLGKHIDRVMADIGSIESPQTRKTILSALVVLTGNDEYRKAMLADIATVAAEYKRQRVDPDRVAKLKSMAEIQEIHRGLMVKYKRDPTAENTVNLLISGLMSGVYDETPPRRLMDWALMKIRNANRKTDNFLTLKEAVFHQYKTAGHDRRKGIASQTVPIPVELRTVITRWKTANDTDWLLLNSRGEPFTSSSLNKRLTSIYGFGVDMLRSIFLSDRYRDVPAMQEMQETAEKMGHSVDAALGYYVKKERLKCWLNRCFKQKFARIGVI